MKPAVRIRRVADETVFDVHYDRRRAGRTRPAAVPRETVVIARFVAHFVVQIVAGRLIGRPCRCPHSGDHTPDGRPALFAKPQAVHTPVEAS